MWSRDLGVFNPLVILMHSQGWCDYYCFEALVFKQLLVWCCGSNPWLLFNLSLSQSFVAEICTTLNPLKKKKNPAWYLIYLTLPEFPILALFFFFYKTAVSWGNPYVIILTVIMYLNMCTRFFLFLFFWRRSKFR